MNYPSHSGHDHPVGACTNPACVVCHVCLRYKIACRCADAAPKLSSNPDPVVLQARIETAWVIIANAGGGDWEKETPEWQVAADTWGREAGYRR